MVADGGMPPQHGPQSIGHEQSLLSSCLRSSAARLCGQQLSAGDASTVAAWSCALQGVTQASDQELVTAARTSNNHTRVMRGSDRRRCVGRAGTAGRVAHSSLVGEQQRAHGAEGSDSASLKMIHFSRAMPSNACL